MVYVKVNESQAAPTTNGILTTMTLPEINVPIYATEDTTDTDNDGLKDWQEVIQGTDPAVADTDGDGTKDGAEIDAGRNPLKKGPDDKGPSTSEIAIDSNTVYKAFVQHSLTDNLSKDLFSAYMQAKNDSVSNGTESDLSSIANTIAQEALTKNELVTKYTAASIGTFPDSDTDAGREYGEKFGSYYINTLQTISQGSNDLGFMAKQYEAFSKNITAIYVPQSLTSTQADIGNNFYNLALMFSIIAKYDEDPVRAALAIKNMKTLLGEQSQMFISVANYFRRNGILFSNQDIQTLWENI